MVVRQRSQHPEAMKLSNLSHTLRFCCKLLFAALLASPQTFAQHLDIEVWGGREMHCLPDIAAQSLQSAVIWMV